MDAGPFVSVISGVIFWIFFLISLGMLKNFIAYGISIAVAEILMKSDTEMREKIVRWLAEDDKIIEHLENIDKKIGH